MWNTAFQCTCYDCIKDIKFGWDTFLLTFIVNVPYLLKFAPSIWKIDAINKIVSENFLFTCGRRDESVFCPGEISNLFLDEEK